MASAVFAAILKPMLADIRYHAPYMEWAKTRATPEIDLAGSNILACTLDDLPGAGDAVALSGANDTGYQPLIEAIAARYKTDPSRVTTCWRHVGGELSGVRRAARAG
jgi:hypothetical protein